MATTSLPVPMIRSSLPKRSTDVAAEPGFVVRPVSIAALLIGALLVTWVVTVDRMRGMDAGPGTNLGALGWFVVIWVTMMAAMMLPSVAPMTLLYAKVSAQRAA